MVSWFHLSTILVIQITQFQLSKGVYEGCEEAVYNLEVVTSCPNSKEEWDVAAIKKNCSKIVAEAKEKNCTIYEIQPKYHCVINAFRNKFLEVCADEKTILGYCAEFNEVGKVIQIHDTASCEKVSPNCDNAYSSLDAYKYPGCYKLVNQTKVTTNIDTDYPESGYVGIIIFIATCIVVVLCGSVVIIAWLKRRKGKEKQETDIEENKSLTETASENSINKGKKTPPCIDSLQNLAADENCSATDIQEEAEAESKPFRTYLYCKARRFQHFHYAYNQIREYKQRLDKENVMPKNVIIKIELVGEFTPDNLQLLPKGKLNKKKKKDENIWEAIPLLCFQNDVLLKSALETQPGKSGYHMILKKSAQDATEKDDSIIIVDQNEQNILPAITSCLEQPLYHILQELSDFHSECTERANEIMALKKIIFDHNEDTKTPTVPDDIKNCLSGISDVVEYTMMRNSSLQVQVKKDTDEKKLRNDLMKMNSKFFEECQLDIVKRKMVKRYTCTESVDDVRNKIAPTTSNEFTNYSQTTYRKDGYVSRKGDLPVLDLPKTPTVINQRGEKSIGFESNRYEDAGKKREIKAHSDDSNDVDLDFDNRDMFYM